jgi:hypothetical protein
MDRHRAEIAGFHGGSGFLRWNALGGCRQIDADRGHPKLHDPVGILKIIRKEIRRLESKCRRSWKNALGVFGIRPQIVDPENPGERLLRAAFSTSRKRHQGRNGGVSKSFTRP